MEKISCIYKIENLDNHKLYIGQTQDYNSRKNSHLSSLRRGKSANKYLQSSFNKHGEDRFQFSIVEQCPVDKLDERERYWIQQLHSYEHGYNMDFGGGGIRGYHFTDEQKEKIRNANKGRIVSEETKRRMRENHADFSGVNHPTYGIKWSDHVSVEKQIEIKKKCSERYSGINNPNYGKKMSDEQKSKLSNSHRLRYKIYGSPLKGRKRIQFQGENAICQREIICLNTGEVFKLIKFAAEKYGIKASQISFCCSQRTSYHAGSDEKGNKLYWMYLSDYELLTENEKNSILQVLQNRSNSNCKKIRCITTGEMFDSMKDACLKYNIDKSSLSAHCRGRKYINGCGYHPLTNELLKWEYA